MYNERALALIQAIKEQEYPLCNYPLPDVVNMAFDVAISAIEKQIPRRAIGTFYSQMRCPACSHRIPSGRGTSSHRRDNWCNYCGQKIDWSVNMEEWKDE